MILAPLRAVADLEFCRQAARRGGRWAAGYLAYLGLLFALAATLALRASFGPRWDEATRWAAASMPRIVLDGGKATSAPAGPLRLAYPGDPSWTIAIDTTRGSPVTLEEMARDGDTVVLTRDTLYLRVSPERLEATPVSRLSGSAPLTLDAAFYRELATTMPRVVYPAAFAGAWLLFVAWKLVATLAYSGLAALFNAASSAGLDRPTQWKLALLAQTPAVLLQIAQLFAPASVPFSSALGIGVVCVYLWKLVRRPESAAALTPP